jgi:hypothetical protein
MWTETRGPDAAPYEAVKPEHVEHVLSCAGQYSVFNEPSEAMAVATLGSPGSFEVWLRGRLAAGSGVVLTLPAAATDAPPETLQGLEMFCQPDPSAPPTPYALATESLNEALRSMAGRSIVIREPAAGWLETRPAEAAISLSWTSLAIGGLLAAAFGYLVLRKK